jgi:hypothetical protein
MAINNLLLDKRVVQLSIKRGLITREQYQNTLDALPDVAHLVSDKLSSVRDAGPDLDDDDLSDDDEDDEDDDEDEDDEAEGEAEA